MTCVSWNIGNFVILVAFIPRKTKTKTKKVIIIVYTAHTYTQIEKNKTHLHTHLHSHTKKNPFLGYCNVLDWMFASFLFNSDWFMDMVMEETVDVNNALW